MIYAINALGYGGVFTAFTFLASIMQELAGLTPWRDSNWRGWCGVWNEYCRV